MKKDRGFTLIELLVVIAVIGILAAIMMVTFASARDKGKDSAILSSVKSFEKLLLMEYVDTGSYTNLQVPITTFYTPEDCALGFTSSAYASDAQAICSTIVRNTSSFTVGHFGGPDPDGQKYSISTHLNIPVYLGVWPTGHDLCVGSNGRSYNGSSVGNGEQTQSGCMNDTHL